MSYYDKSSQMDYIFGKDSVVFELFKILCGHFYHDNNGQLHYDCYYYDNLDNIGNFDGLIGGKYSRVEEKFSYFRRYKYADIDTAGRPIQIMSMELHDKNLDYSIVGKMHFIDKFGPLHPDTEFPEMKRSASYDKIFLCECKIQVPNVGLDYWIQIQSEGSRVVSGIEHNNFKISIYDVDGYVQFKASEPDAQQEKRSVISYIPNALDPNFAIVLDSEGNEIGNVLYKDLLEFFSYSNNDYEKILSSNFPSFKKTTNKSNKHF